MLSDPVKLEFNRTPYTVRYQDLEGNLKSIRRVPPPKLHDMLPKDKVSLQSKKNDDWNAGNEFTIKAINPKQANTIQIANDEGDYTFVSYYDLSLEQRVGSSGFEDPRDNPINNEYLIWP